MDAARALIAEVEEESLKEVAGLFKPREDPAFNASGDLPESQVPFRTKFAAKRYQSVRESEAAVKTAIAIKFLELPRKQDDDAADVIDVDAADE